MRERGFAGIDVACATGKRLPVVVCCWQEGRLVPHPLARLPFHPPVGRGNSACCDAAVVMQPAQETAEYLRRVEEHLGLTIVRIGIDAPRAPRKPSHGRRPAEVALDAAAIRCFTTPSEQDFRGIIFKVADHLSRGGAVSRLPHANQLWMLVGFGLFSELRHIAECLEVYPQATVQQLGVHAEHKSAVGAAARQLAGAAKHTGWPNNNPADFSWNEIAFGPPHDRLDAYLSAWVAALDESDRIPLGVPPDDVIWVPRTRKNAPFEDCPAPAVTSPQPVPPAHRARSCPACVKKFKAFPLGWNAHAAHVCPGLQGETPEEREREYKLRFGNLFNGG